MAAILDMCIGQFFNNNNDENNGKHHIPNKVLFHFAAIQVSANIQKCFESAVLQILRTTIPASGSGRESSRYLTSTKIQEIISQAQ